MLVLLFFSTLFGIADVEGRASGHRTDDEKGETVVFLIPEDPNNVVSAYIYDAERNHLLISSKVTNAIRSGLPKNRSTDEWTVLPGTVRAYTSPSFDSPLSEVTLSYPQKIVSASNSQIVSSQIRWVAFRHGDTKLYLPEPLLAKRSIPGVAVNSMLPIGSEVVDRNTPLPWDYKPGDLVKVAQKWNFHAPDYPKYLRSEAAAAIDRMLSAARRQGIHLRIFSGYRSFEKQRYLYLREIDKKGIKQILVAKPGHSEHQLGTAADLCGLSPESVANANFGSSSEGKWLIRNGGTYGFVNSYRLDNMKEHGYAYEPWHYRYMGVPNKQLKEKSNRPHKR